MKDKLKFKSINSFLKPLLILLIGGIGALTVSFLMIEGTLKGPYPQIIDIILGAFFGVIGAIALISIYKLDTILVYSDHYKIKSIFGHVKKNIKKDSIITWTEIEKANKYDEWKELIIYTSKCNYKLSSSIYENYSELRNNLISGKKNNLKKEIKLIKRKNAVLAVFFLMTGGCCLFFAFNFYYMNKDEISYYDLQTISGVITNKAEIHTGSKGSGSISINLRSYPSFNFYISGNSLKATNISSYIENVKIGDTLNLEILKDEYQKKLTKEMPLSFWDKTINYSFISVYGLRDKNSSFLHLNDYIYELKNDWALASLFLWVFFIVGLFMIGAGIYLFKNLLVK